MTDMTKFTTEEMLEDRAGIVKYIQICRLMVENGITEIRDPEVWLGLAISSQIVIDVELKQRGVEIPGETD